MEAARRAVAQLADLTGRPPDAVSGVESTEDGWLVHVDLVELARIPPATDILATYEATLTPGGTLVEYHRVRRFHRDQTDEL